MKPSIPSGFDLSTLILLAQTLYDILENTFLKLKKNKNLVRNNLIGFLVFIFFTLWFVWFFDFGFRAMIIFLTGNGYDYKKASIITIFGYYLGYNLAKKLNSVKELKNSADGIFVSNLFIYLPSGILGCLITGFLLAYIKTGLN